MRTRGAMVFAFGLCCAACYADRVVGASGPASSDAASKPRVASLILPQPGESIVLDDPNLGDLDADGFDDFVIRGSPYDGRTTWTSGTRYYLFYGRSDFPAQLSTADADAVLDDDGSYPVTPLGDINGDGFDDFALLRYGVLDFVFGSRERLHGAVAMDSAGPSWRHPGVPLPTPSGLRATDLRVSSARDWNGDGVDDLAVTASRLIASEEHVEDVTHLVLGVPGQWLSGEWDPVRSRADFGAIETRADFPGALSTFDYLSPFGARDTDGDGHDDLIAARYTFEQSQLYVFYGGRTLAGTIAPSQADAQLELPNQQSLEDVVDLDGDGVSDFVFISGDGSEVSVSYGRRLSAHQTLAPDLTIELDASAYCVSVVVGDIDGSGGPELVIGAMRWSSEPKDGAAEPGVYVVRGSGERASGRIRLDARHLLSRDVVSLAATRFEASSSFVLRMAGDVNGDGGRDLLTSAAPSFEGPGGVSLIPSAPRAPD